MCVDPVVTFPHSGFVPQSEACGGDHRLSSETERLAQIPGWLLFLVHRGIGCSSCKVMGNFERLGFWPKDTLARSMVQRECVCVFTDAAVFTGTWTRTEGDKRRPGGREVIPESGPSELKMNLTC